MKEIIKCDALSDEYFVEKYISYNALHLNSSYKTEAIEWYRKTAAEKGDSKAERLVDQSGVIEPNGNLFFKLSN